MFRSSGPGQVPGSYVANQVLVQVHVHVEVFETQERKKERTRGVGQNDVIAFTDNANHRSYHERKKDSIRQVQIDEICK